jgi:hypothetical protein
VDEFQNFATESFAILQSEARKYAVDVVVAHQFRDQLDDLSKGSTLNVGNLVVFRTTGRDSYDLAAQFDNTPPPPEKVMEPVFRPYRELEGGEQIYSSPRSPTGAGQLYHEVERLRRTYSDMEGEMANKLSILKNYEAKCRLIHIPGENRRPSLVEHHMVIEKPGDNDYDPVVAAKVRRRARRMARPRLEVEKEIERRSHGAITVEYVADSEKLHNEQNSQ